MKLNQRFINTLIIIFIILIVSFLLLRFKSYLFLEITIEIKRFLLAIFILILLIVISITNMYRSKTVFIQLGIWGIIILILVIIYAFRFELKYVANRVMAVLVPSYSWVRNNGEEIVISKHQDGHFYVNAIINGVIIHFIIDTGASDIALTRTDAQKLNIDLSKLTYTKQYYTANGVSYGAPVLLSYFQIGNVVFEDVMAHVSSGNMNISLLGMSMIKRFNFNVNNDLLLLKPQT